MYIYHFPKKINNNFNDINELINIYNKIKNIKDSNITLNFRDTNWMSGELVALLGAICYNIKHKYNKENLYIACSKNVETTFQSNSFSKQIINMQNGNTKTTAIEYKCFNEELNNNNLNCFDDYIKKELNEKLEFKQEEIDYICLFLSEIFVNARTHGRTHNIFCCGQKYPKMNKIKILLVDLGIGIPYNVRKKTNKNMNDIECIKWSLKKGNSTKMENAGGLGLYDIFEFVKQHNGNISIISYKGQFNYNENIEIISNENFDGTIISIEFDYTSIQNIENMFKRIRKEKNFIEF